jgi:putative DNA primase/helicase
MTCALEKAAFAAQRPVITLTPGTLPQTVDAIEDALINAGAPIYARGETLVRAVPAAPEPGAVRRAGGAMILTPVSAVSLQDDLEAVADFERIVEGNEGATTKRVGAPVQACNALLQRIGRWNFPPLRGIASCPFMRADGSIASRPGYDKASGLLLAIPHHWPSPKPAPTRDDALLALAKLRHLIRTFCFVAPADESVMLSAMLTPLVRPGIDAAPMHGFSAPVRGSGKSLLTDIVAIIATGRPAACVSWGPSQEENTKALTAALLAGDSVLTLDNVEVGLRGELLCSLDSIWKCTTARKRVSDGCRKALHAPERGGARGAGGGPEPGIESAVDRSAAGTQSHLAIA